MQPNRVRLIHRDELQYVERFGINFSLSLPLGDRVRFNTLARVSHLDFDINLDMLLDMLRQNREMEKGSH